MEEANVLFWEAQMTRCAASQRLRAIQITSGSVLSVMSQKNSTRGPLPAEEGPGNASKGIFSVSDLGETLKRLASKSKTKISRSIVGGIGEKMRCTLLRKGYLL